MPAGLQVHGTHGVLQIDSTYRNLALRAKHTVVTTTLAPVVGGGVSFTDLISLAGIANPVIAVASADYCSPMWGTPNGQLQIVAAGPVGTAVTVYVFGEPPPVETSYGLQVYNDAGVLVFDAARKYMRVVGMADMTTGGDWFTTFPSGKTYAAVINGGSKYESYPAGPSQAMNIILRGMVKFTGTTIGFRMNAINSFLAASAIGNGDFMPANILALDVSHF